METAGTRAATTPETTRPSATRSPGDALVLRATTDWLFILSLQQDYLAKEGPAHRGPAFEKLAGALNTLIVPVFVFQISGVTRKSIEPFSEREVFAVLGPPDFWDSLPIGSAMVYRFRRDIKGAAVEWHAYIDFDADGLVKHFGWNAASVNGTAGLAPFHLISLQPTTRPKQAEAAPGTGYVGIQVGSNSWQKDGHTFIGTHGVFIERVVRGAPGDLAGLRSGDLIESIGDEEADSAHFNGQVSKLRPGQVVKFTILRGEKAARQTVEVTIGARPGPATTQASEDIHGKPK